MAATAGAVDDEEAINEEDKGAEVGDVGRRFIFVVDNCDCRSELICKGDEVEVEVDVGYKGRRLVVV